MKDKGQPACLLSEQTLYMFCLGQVHLVNGSDGLCSSGRRRVLSTDWKLGAWNAADGAHSLQRAGAASLDGPETILGVICKCAMQIWMTAGPLL